VHRKFDKYPNSIDFNDLKNQLSLLLMEEQSRRNQQEIKVPAAD